MVYIKEKNQVYLINDENKVVAYIKFPLINNQTVIINHTFVDENLRGMNIADTLIRYAIEIIKQQNKFAIPVCSYAIKWFNEHQDIVKPILLDEKE